MWGVVVILSLLVGVSSWVFYKYSYLFYPKPQGRPLRTITRLELSLASADNSTHLYLSILGHVFDVSAGGSYYGKGGGYAFFAGRDATRAFATGDFTQDGLVESVENLSTTECLAIQKWLQFYQAHKKYAHIGYLEDSPYIVGSTRAMREFQQCAKRGGQVATDEKIRSTCSIDWNLQTRVRKVWCDTPGMVPRKASFMESTGVLKEECMCIPIQQINERRDLSLFGQCGERDTVCQYIAD